MPARRLDMSNYSLFLKTMVSLLKVDVHVGQQTALNDKNRNVAEEPAAHRNGLLVLLSRY